MENLKEKFSISGHMPEGYEVYEKEYLKESVLEFEEILNFQKDNPMGYDSKTHILLIIKKYKKIFGDFK